MNRRCWRAEFSREKLWDAAGATFLTRVVVKMTFVWERNNSGANCSDLLLLLLLLGKKMIRRENIHVRNFCEFYDFDLEVNLKWIQKNFRSEATRDGAGRPLDKLNDLLTSHNSQMIGCVTMCRHLCKCAMNESRLTDQPVDYFVKKIEKFDWNLI
jgi:hypothetical protein